MGKHDELHIQAQCFRYLRSLGIFCHSVPNEAYGRSMIAQQQLMASGLVPGVADMIVWWKKNEKIQIGYIEFKTKTGRQSKYQKNFETKCKINGIRYDLVRSLSDLEKVVKDIELENNLLF